MTHSTDNTLKPCPFCGKNAKMVRRMNWGFRAECQHCCVTGSAFRPDRDFALDDWNRRADLAPDALEPCDPLADAGVKALEDALTEAAKQHRIIAGMGLMSASSVAYNAAREAEAALAAFDKGGKDGD